MSAMDLRSTLPARFSNAFDLAHKAAAAGGGVVEPRRCDEGLER